MNFTAMGALVAVMKLTVLPFYCDEATPEVQFAQTRSVFLLSKIAFNGIRAMAVCDRTPIFHNFERFPGRCLRRPRGKKIQTFLGEEMWRKTTLSTRHDEDGRQLDRRRTEGVLNLCAREFKV